MSIDKCSMTLADIMDQLIIAQELAQLGHPFIAVPVLDEQEYLAATALASAAVVKICKRAEQELKGETK